MGAVSVTRALKVSQRTQRYKRLFESDRWAQPTDDEVVNYVQEFEDYMTAQLGVVNNSFKQQERVRMLLAMLAWSEGLSSEEKDRRRYMEIERSDQEDHVINRADARRGKVNEYSRRPVLPTPLDIDDDQLDEAPPQNPSYPQRARPNERGRKYIDPKKVSGKTAFELAMERAKSPSK